MTWDLASASVRPLGVVFVVGLLSIGLTPACAKSRPVPKPSAAKTHRDAGTKRADAGTKPSDAGDHSEPTADSGSAVDPDQAGEVFDPDVVREYQMTVDPADWDRIKRFPVKEEYIRGTLVFEGHTFDPVALRFKGARGSLYGCFRCCSTSDTLTNCPGPEQACYDDNGMIAQSTCSRFSMKMDFSNDWGDADFYGLDRLNFHAAELDPTGGLRERLAYFIFQDFGVVAPRTASATLSVNGEDLGVFTIVEAEGSAFVKHHFRDGKAGNLYKQRWPTISTDPGYYQSGLETNKQSADLSKIVELAQMLAKSTDETIGKVLEEKIDIDPLMRLLAVDRAIFNFDGPLTFRCKDQSTIPALPPDLLAAQEFPLPWETCQNKNYYLYQEPKGRFYLIPWDLNLTLLPIPMTDWTAPPDSSCDQLQWNGRLPQCDPMVRWLATAKYPQYIEAVQELLKGPFDLDHMSATLDQWATSEMPAALAHDKSLTAAQFAGGLSSIKTQVASLRADLQSQISPPP